MELDRPDPDDLLRKVENDERKPDGKLKIFFGYAAGVGKTYAMLEAAHHAQQEGLDVVAGYIEPHTRVETMALLDGLERLPPLQIKYKGITLKEFDLDGALARHPQLILVDELAHTNAETCRHRKRYQDIEELLHAGIDVYTTVNVQHLESLNDVISSITNVVVSERIPDRVFDSASQVEVVDIEPDDLIERLRQGKVYGKQQAQKALTNFFSRKNLAALREIALRRTADRLNRSAGQLGGSATKNAGEHILTCISSAPSNAKVIRTAARMAEAFHSDFTALYVEGEQEKEPKEDDGRRLRANMELAEVLGAHIVTVYGDDVAIQIAEYAKAAGVTKIVIGRSNGKSRMLFAQKNLVEKLTELAPGIDIHIIPDSQPAYRAKRSFGKFRNGGFRFSWLDLGKSVLVVILATLISAVFYAVGFGEANIITVYILGVLFASILAEGWVYGAVVALLSVLSFNFFFTVPRFTLHAYDASYPVTFLVMFVASMITSSLTMRIKTQGRQAAEKSYRTELLLETSRKLEQAEDASEIMAVTAQQMCKLLGRPVLFYPVDTVGTILAPVAFSSQNESVPDSCLDESEQAVAYWVAQNGKPAGRTTDTLPSARCLYFPVRGQGNVLAVAAVSMLDTFSLDAFEKNLLIAMLGECGMSLEKTALHEAKQQMEFKAQQETLRANLLRAISHDLRTPLTSISGNAGILMENSKVLDEAKRQQLYTDIYDDSLWLVSLVENLLAVTRIENGTMDIKLEPELLEDVFHEALSHLDRKSTEHEISVSLSDDLLMARMDARLIVQVIINIVNNAIKYTQKGSRICLSAERIEQGMVRIQIADDGPGISDDAKKHVFEMFYTADNDRGDGRRGLGLGLSLCKSIIDAHGGTIGIQDNKPKGTLFYFTLQAAEVDYSE